MEYDYSKLGENGIIEENEIINDKTILIGKVKKNQYENFYVDESVGPKKGQLGYVDKTFLCDYKDNERLAKVRIRHDRIPAIGDKFCSRAGQKGTIGIVLPEEDMPFTENGLRPDIIVNPHAMPSRMTIGHLIEALTAKACCIYGGFGDCTAFENKGPKHKEFGDLLINEGFHSTGNEIMYNGMTGEQLETEIYIGPTYYERLKHMVKDKINYRSRGKRDSLTRQTVGGRANDGGLRIGEMDRDAVLSHGIATFLNESMMERGDKYQMAICNKSGTIAIHNPYKNSFISPMLDGPIKFEFDNNEVPSIIPMSKFGKDFSIINVPYAFKLLYQELVSLNVQMRIITEDNVDKLTSLTNKNQVFKLINRKLYNKKNNMKKVKKHIDKIKRKLLDLDTDEDISKDERLEGIKAENFPTYMEEKNEKEGEEKEEIDLDKSSAFQYKDIESIERYNSLSQEKKEKLFGKMKAHLDEKCFQTKKGDSFNGDIWLNHIATFSITNCLISNKITDFILNLPFGISNKKFIIADCTASIGGNSMSFIRKFSKTISIEIDRPTHELLKRNLELVRDKLGIKNTFTTVCDSYNGETAMSYINPSQGVKHDGYPDVLFFDPPWGGAIDYSKKKKKNRMNIDKIKLGENTMDNVVLDMKTSTDNIKYSVLKLPHVYDYRDFKKNIKTNDTLSKIKLIKVYYVVVKNLVYNIMKIKDYKGEIHGKKKMMIIVVKYNKYITKSKPSIKLPKAVNGPLPKTKQTRIPEGVKKKTGVVGDNSRGDDDAPQGIQIQKATQAESQQQQENNSVSSDSDAFIAPTPVPGSDDDDTTSGDSGAFATPASGGGSLSILNKIENLESNVKSNIENNVKKKIIVNNINN